MTNSIRVTTKAAGTCVLLLTLLAWPLAAQLIPTAKPEEVGLSSERLGRISQMMQRRIAAADIAGGVTLVARKGRIAHLEAHGVMDLESRKPMPKDAVFRLASMTKPIAGVAIMMMLEEGKLRLSDPVSKFIPELRIRKWRWPSRTRVRRRQLASLLSHLGSTRSRPSARSRFATC